jgi:ABC-type branched-subunit amino acid transport system ATPase component
MPPQGGTPTRPAEPPHPDADPDQCPDRLRQHDRSRSRGVAHVGRQRQIVALLGANGAGKSTTLKAISGVLYPEDGEVKGGQITFENQPLTGMTPDRIVRAGVVMVPEGRRLFDQLTVEENLLMGGYTRRWPSPSSAWSASMPRSRA